MSEQKPRRLADAAGRGRLEGESIDMSDILEEEVLVTAFGWRNSQFEGRAQYLVIQIERNGQLQVFTTGSNPIVDMFEGVHKEDLPLQARFVEKSGGGGRRYYTVI